MRALLSLFYLIKERLHFVKTTPLGPFDISSVRDLVSRTRTLWYFHEITIEVLSKSFLAIASFVKIGTVAAILY
jgi:hypothetical protein